MCWLCFSCRRLTWKASRLCYCIICAPRIVLTVEREFKGWILRPTVSWHRIFVLSSFFLFFISLIFIILVTLCPKRMENKVPLPSLKIKLFSVLRVHSKLWFFLTGWLVWNVLNTRYVCEKSLYYWLLKAGSFRDNTLSSWMLTGLAAMLPEMFWSLL